MTVAVAAEGIEQGGRVLHQFPAGRLLAVEDTQRVGVPAAPAVLAQTRADPLQVGDQPLLERRPAHRAAERVELQADRQAEFVQEHLPHGDEFGVDPWFDRTDDLRVQLVELAEATFLRPFVAEHGADGVEALHRLLDMQAVFDEGAHDRGRGLGPHGDAFIGEAVHFLLDHVSGRADGTDEQLGLFQDRHADLLHAEPFENVPGPLFDILPADHTVRKDVFETVDRLNLQGALRMNDGGLRRPDGEVDGSRKKLKLNRKMREKSSRWPLSMVIFLYLTDRSGR